MGGKKIGGPTTENEYNIEISWLRCIDIREIQAIDRQLNAILSNRIIHRENSVMKICKGELMFEPANPEYTRHLHYVIEKYDSYRKNKSNFYNQCSEPLKNI